jgi:hypothetical protein
MERMMKGGLYAFLSIKQYRNEKKLYSASPCPSPYDLLQASR